MQHEHVVGDGARVELTTKDGLSRARAGASVEALDQHVTAQLQAWLKADAQLL